MRFQLTMLLLAGLAPPALFAQAGQGKPPARLAPAGDWPLYSRDPASTRYSPLKQINTGNVSKVALAWSYKPSPLASPPGDTEKAAAKGKGKGGGGAGLSPEVTPSVVNGVMYLPGGRRVFALEADTGKEIWTFAAPGPVGNRAVGYWPGDQSNPPRILFTTGSKMMALNANTGKVDPGFGNEGAVEIGLNWGGAPYVYKNLIVLGIDNGESTEGPPGDTRTVDARTGAKSWTFK